MWSQNETEQPTTEPSNRDTACHSYSTADNCDNRMVLELRSQCDLEYFSYLHYASESRCFIYSMSRLQKLFIVETGIQQNYAVASSAH